MTRIRPCLCSEDFGHGKHTKPSDYVTIGEDSNFRPCKRHLIKKGSFKFRHSINTKDAAMISPLARSALDFAIACHKDQCDKVDGSMMTHVVSVACGAASYTGADISHNQLIEQMFIIGLLHDTIEDGFAEADEIATAFGQEIADVVVVLTRVGREPYTSYIERVATHPVARLVKIADIQDNLRPERVAKLPADERGIVERYRKALVVLEAAV